MGLLHDESFQSKNVAAGTYGPYALAGGYYEFALSCTGTPAAQVEKLMPDATTWTKVFGRQNVADQSAYLDVLVTEDKLVYENLAPGSYRVVIATSTANYFALTRVPQQ